MLDQDGNERIDKGEFKVLETVFSSAARERKTQPITETEGDTDQDAAKPDNATLAVKKVFDDTDHRLSR